MHEANKSQQLARQLAQLHSVEDTSGTWKDIEDLITSTQLPKPSEQLKVCILSSWFWVS